MRLQWTDPVPALYSAGNKVTVEAAGKNKSEFYSNHKIDRGRTKIN